MNIANLRFTFVKQSPKALYNPIFCFLTGLTCLALSVLIPQPASSQSLPAFDHLVPTEELSTTSTTAIFQDHYGYIWIGTTNGLNRFNGRSVKKYFATPSDSNTISNSYVSYNAIIEHNNFLWIGTQNGLTKYDHRTDQFESFYHTLSDSSSLCGQYVNAVLPADSSSLWLGTENGLCKLDIHSGLFETFIHSEIDSSNVISSLALDTSNDLWLGSHNGLYRYDQAQNILTPFDSDSYEEKNSIPHLINALQIDGDYLWIGTERQGIIQLHIPTLTFNSINTPSNSNPGTNIITDFELDRAGTLWVATFGDGLCKLEQNASALSCYQKDNETPSSLIDDQVMGVMQDYEGHIWASTWNGVTKKNRSRGFSSSSDPFSSLSKLRINAMYEDENNHLWIGSISSGLIDFDPVTGHNTFHNHDPQDSNTISNNEIWSITGDAETLWIATGAGFNELKRSTGIFKRFFNRQDDPSSLSDNFVYSTLLAKDGSVWVGTVRQGLNKFIDRKRGIFQRFMASTHTDSLSSNTVWPLYQSDDNTLWVGTLNGGVNKYDIKENRFKRFTYSAKPDSINSNDILDITGDNQGNLWIGTQANGLNGLELSTERFIAYTEKDGLANNEVSCVVPEGDKRLWIGTRNGLSVFVKSSGTFLNFYEQDGLPSVSFQAGACLRRSAGTFLFGTDKGVISFSPDDIDLEIPPPRLVISEFRTNNQIAPFDIESPEIVLEHKENSLSFRVLALTYSGIEKSQLYYRMTGLDTTWLPVEQNGLIPFTTLPANNYTLEVKGKNSFGVYNERPLILEITINPPYWQTWWFRLLAGFLVLSIIAAILRTRVNFLVALEREAQTAKNLRTEIALTEERAALKTEKLRNEFAADFHDNIGVDLGILGLDIDLIADDEKTPPDVRAQLSPLRESINKLSDMRSEMGWVINAKNDSIEKLIERIRQIAFQMVPSNILSLQISNDLPNIGLPMGIRKHLLNFVKEALNNAIKHAKASEIGLTISENEGIFTFIIADDGIGFDIATVKKGEGLDSMSFRAVSIAGDFSVIHPDKGGTIINLSVKIDDSSHYAS